MKKQAHKNYLYKILANHKIFHFYFCLTVALQFLVLSMAYAQSTKLCRHYFIHTDLLESFSADEKTNFLTLAEKYSQVTEQPHAEVSEIKILLNHELTNFINSKKLDTYASQLQSEDILSLFLSLVRDFQQKRFPHRQSQVMQKINFQHQLSQQSVLHRKYTKYYRLLKSYNVENFEDLLAAIFINYETQDVFEAFLRSNGKLLDEYEDKFVPDLLEIEYLLEWQVNRNKVDEQGLNVLVYAAIHGTAESVRFLIKAGIDMENSKGNSNPLISAIDASNMKTALALIQAGVSIETFDFSTYNTPLIQAAGVANLRSRLIAKSLIKAGANINRQNKDGQTALMIAIDKFDLEMLRILLEAKANLDLQDSEGRTALMGAIIKSDVMVQDLLQAGANINLQSKNGDTALMLACGTGNTPLVQTLINAGANLKLMNHQDMTALYIAAAYNHQNNINALLRAGVSVDEKNPNGDTALMVAAHFAHPQSVEALLHAKADTRLTNNQGKTALAIARSSEPVASPMQTNRDLDPKRWKKDKKQTIRLLKAKTPEEPSVFGAWYAWLLKKLQD